MPEHSQRLLKPREVARLFDVEVTTVVEWARIGKIRSLKTPGGQQYRFRPADVEALLHNHEQPEMAQ